MANNATPWPKMIRAVYASFNTGQHANDHIARNVMDRIVSWLTDGKSLSPKLQKSLLDNINMRTRFQVVDPGTPVQLTRHQLGYAKKINPEWFGLGLSSDDSPAENLLKGDHLSASLPSCDPAFQQVFSTLSATIQQVFSSLSALFPHQALVLAQELVTRAAENCGSGEAPQSSFSSKVMECEAKECNHEPDGDVIRPSDDMRLAGSPGEDLVQEDVRLAGSPGNVASPSSQVVTPPAHQPAALHPRAEGVEERHGEEPARPEIAISWFHNDPNRPPTASLEAGGERFSLVFGDSDRVEDVLSGVCDRDWMERFEEAGGRAVRAQSRSAQGITRYRLSALYDARDTFARKKPVVRNAVAVVAWSAGQPQTVQIVIEDDLIEVPLRPFSGRSPKAPTFKGTLKMGV